MADFSELTGPWLGWSIQEGLRISERMRLIIRGTVIEGEGTDMDGEFELTGSYDPRTERVLLTRRYYNTTEPSQSGVGIPYDYEGKWDGTLVGGMWHPRANPHYGGEFEMWPDRDEETETLRLEELHIQELTLPRSATELRMP